MTTLFPQTSDWRTSMKEEVSVAIDDTFGESVLVTPTRSGGVNFPRIAEPGRAVNAIAVFKNEAKTILMGNEHRYGGHSLSPLVSTSEPVFQFDGRALPWPLLQGYRVMLCRTGETFEVTDIKPDGIARITVNVVQLGRQSDAR